MLQETVLLSSLGGSCLLVSTETSSIAVLYFQIKVRSSGIYGFTKSYFLLNSIICIDFLMLLSIFIKCDLVAPSHINVSLLTQGFIKELNMFLNVFFCKKFLSFLRIFGRQIILIFVIEYVHSRTIFYQKYTSRYFAVSLCSSLSFPVQILISGALIDLELFLMLLWKY